MKKIIWIAGLIFLSVSAIIGQQGQIRVTILHANDTYQFTPVDEGKRGGLARLLTLKKTIQAENPNLIFTFGGDTLSPSVETRKYKGAQMIEAWNAVGIDLAVFGNHEFDIKIPELMLRIKESRFQWLGANIITDSQTNKIFADTPPFVIREVGGVKIGFIGLLLPEAKETSGMLAPLAIRDFCDTAREFVPKMRAAGANAVIGITHMFMRQDKELAKCAEFDLILGGHEHTLLQSSSAGTPIFKMTADARELGRFNLNFDAKTKQLGSMDWEIIPVTDKIADAPEFTPIFDKYKHLLEQLAVRVGATSVELDALSASGRTKETNIGNFIADAYRHAVGADIGFVNGGSLRADTTYRPGPLTKRDVLSILAYDNPIVKVKLTGRLLKEVLEHGVAASGGEESEPGRFPQISGMSYVYDPKKPRGQRVISVKVGGSPLDENKSYTLATSDFLVSKGGDGYAMFAKAERVTEAMGAPVDSAVLEAAIRNAPDKTISPKLEGRITRLP